MYDKTKMVFLFFNLRYNGHLPSGDKGRRKSKFILWKRAAGNGVKPYRKHIVKNPQASKVIC